VITVPDAPNSTSSPDVLAAARRNETVSPRASAICDEIVRFQISS
jgi:hypothetical protein